VVGFLLGGSLTDMPTHLVTAFHQGLKEAGFVEGQNVAIEYRSAEHQTDRLRLLVADLLHRQVALIVGDTPAALAAKAVTTTVPIVFVTGGDPVRVGLVASLNRPGGNVTGVSFTSIELAAKQLGLLRELRPGAARVAVLVDPKFPTTERFVSEVQAAASAIGQQLIVLEVSSDREIETAFTTLVQRGAGALFWGVANLSYGVQRQLEIVLALAGNPKLLLLDEPMAGLSASETHLASDIILNLDRAITVLLIEHDLAAAFRIADRVTAMDQGRVVAEGTPDEIRKESSLKRIYMGAGAAASKNGAARG
jgi:ABC transporter substrate binding protein/ABC transporter family protein